MKKEEGKKGINKLYHEGVFSLVNNIGFVVYYVLTLIALPLVYLNQELFSRVIVVLAYISLMIIAVVMKGTEKNIKEKTYRKK